MKVFVSGVQLYGLVHAGCFFLTLLEAFCLAAAFLKKKYLMLVKVSNPLTTV